jgi:hypothetical protein
MADYIPFVNSGRDLTRLRTYYEKPVVARVQLSGVGRLRRRLIPNIYPLWIDPEIDGYHRLLRKGEAWPDWNDHISQFKNCDLLADPDFVQKPDAGRIAIFVGEVLEKCRKSDPAWITVPQLPLVGDSKRNNVNRALAKATASWKAESKFEGHLVLPLIFTHQSQLKGKTQWKPKLQVAKRCYDAANADAVWTVDSDLSDWKGAAGLTKRFGSLIAFHTDLRKCFPNARVIAGPYWGMNIVLWARSLCDYPAITLGYGFTYRISGGYRGMEPTATVALSPLYRLARHTDELGTWIQNAVAELHKSDEAAKQLARLKGRFKELARYEIARNQVAEFYGAWLRNLNTIPPSGRSLALFQDLTSAYVLGKKFREELSSKVGRLPKSEAPAQDPHKVAEQLMLHCL